MKEIPKFQDILDAKERIGSHIHNTPVLKSEGINRILDVELFFKCENFQKVGAFKYRGATNAVLSLSQEEMKYGVATHSSGNHAAALSLAAKRCAVPAYIVMPLTAPEIKKNAVKEYGGEITFCEPTLQARESTLKEVQQMTGAHFIHPYDNTKVVCGQGTVAIEFLDEIPGLDIIMTPVGGGGLLSGVSIAAKSINSNITVIAGEPKNADDAYRSFYGNKLVPTVNPDTIADGLLTSLSDLTFEIIKNNVDDIYTVQESSIVKAMRMIWERMKIVIEPSSAVPLAAVMENNSVFRGKKVGIVLSGGNVNVNQLPF